MLSKNSNNRNSIETTKHLVRNAEQNITSSLKHRGSVKCSISDNVIKSIMKKPAKTTSPEQKFDSPDLHSTRAIVRQIKKIEETPFSEFKNFQDIPKEDRTKAEKEVSKTLNFHFNEKIFKDLVALNIEDSPSLGSRSRGKSPSRRLPPGAAKDLEPHLPDFYQDRERLDQPLRVPAVRVRPMPVVKFDGTDIHKRMRSYETP